MLQDIDKQAVAASFSKAACHYDQFAQLQRDIGEQLLQHVEHANVQTLVDLGCGTGYFSEKLASRFKQASLTCFDLSTAMLAQTKQRQIRHAHYQQGDIDNLPFAENSLDVVYSNLVVQWSEDLQGCLTQIKHRLKAGGKAYLSTLLIGSLDELTQAWKQVDNHPHTNRFLGLASIQTMLNTLEVQETSIKTETRTLYYQNVLQVMRALKGIGANHVHSHQATQVTGKALLKQLETGYQPYINAQGLLPLTYHVCYIEIKK